MFRLLSLVVVMIVACAVLPMSAQRRITPVTPTNPGSKPPVTDVKQTIDPTSLRLHWASVRN